MKKVEISDFTLNLLVNSLTKGTEISGEGLAATIAATPNPAVAIEKLLGVYTDPVLPSTVTAVYKEDDAESGKIECRLVDYDPWYDNVSYVASIPRDKGKLYFPAETSIQNNWSWEYAKEQGGMSYHDAERLQGYKGYKFISEEMREVQRNASRRNWEAGDVTVYQY